MAERYRARVGINYVPVGAKLRSGRPAEVRREPGEVFDDLPPPAAASLLEAGAIEPAPGERIPRAPQE